MYAEDDSLGRLTGTLAADGNGCRGGIAPGAVAQQADDDLNWLHGISAGSQVYIPSFKTFINPSTKNAIDPNHWANTLMDLGCPPAGNQTTVTLWDELKYTADDRNTASNHSYEVFGCWKDQSRGYTRKTIRSVLSYSHIQGQQNGNAFVGQSFGPSGTWIIMDSLQPHKNVGFNYENFPNQYDSHGVDGAHVSCCDGHAEWINRAEWNTRYEMSEDNGRQLTPYY
jgi:hypothetical protein